MGVPEWRWSGKKPTSSHSDASAYFVIHWGYELSVNEIEKEKINASFTGKKLLKGNSVVSVNEN